jgi:hypothetical protein
MYVAIIHSQLGLYVCMHFEVFFQIYAVGEGVRAAPANNDSPHLLNFIVRKTYREPLGKEWKRNQIFRAEYSITGKHMEVKGG